jgi:acyl-coenzyme A thioesterase PaaI-like protein
MSEPDLASDGALTRLAEAIRRISGVAVGRPISNEQLIAAAETLESVATTLESVAEPRKRPRLQPTPDVDPRQLFPTSPVIGVANPIAPPAYVWAVEGEDGLREIRGRVTFDYPYEGPPTCVHGGVIAELFDELLGSANIIAGKAGMTGTLTIRYRRPTPLLTPLDLVARYTGSERRKSFAWAGIYHEGELTAEADGIFIAMQPGRMLDIVTTNAREATAPVVDPDFVDLIAERAADPM